MSDPVFRVDGVEYPNPGEWLRTQCSDLQVSVAMVAREARLSKSTLSRWMADRNKPYWDSVERIKGAVSRIREKKSGSAA